MRLGNKIRENVDFLVNYFEGYAMEEFSLGPIF